MATRKKKAPPTFVNDSPFVKVQKEVNQAPGVRQELIAKLEENFGARVITYFASFQKAEAIVVDDDAEIMESILAVEKPDEKLVLVLNSSGGYALAAERIVNVCRAYSNNRFEVVIPHMAKSAATMICFGAAVIHMSKTAELGPVDPQISYQDEHGKNRWISADEYVKSYEKLIDQASDGKAKRIEPFIQQLSRYDARHIEGLKSAQKLSEDISVKLLKALMLSQETEGTIRERIKVFLAHEETSAHGRMINFDGAKACGLNVKLIDLHSTTWNMLWELYVRSNWAVSNMCAKIIESKSSAVQA